MSVRTMVHIDEDKCDGCGLCVPDSLKALCR